MGVLRDTKFWAETLNELVALAPKPGQAISEENAARMREIACAALGRLVEDKDFKSDLEAALALVATGNVGDPTVARELRGFLEQFMVVERKLLTQAGVNEQARNDLEFEIATVANAPDLAYLDRLDDLIAFCRKLACEPNPPKDPDQPFWQRAWRGVKGVAVISVDIGAAAGATTIFAPAGAAAAATVAGTSVGYGIAIVHHAVRGRW